MNWVSWVWSEETGWVALGLFVAGLYAFAVRMTHRQATKGLPARTRTGEFRRVGLANGSERRTTAEMQAVSSGLSRPTSELRPIAAPQRSLTLTPRPTPDHAVPVAARPRAAMPPIRPQD